VTLLDPSQAMLDKAGSAGAAARWRDRRRVTLLRPDARGERRRGQNGRLRFAAVLCHGVARVPRAAERVSQLCQCGSGGGVVSI